MNHRELQQAQKEFKDWLATVPGFQSTGIRTKNNTLFLCIYHTSALGNQGKRRIATELGDIPVMFEQVEKQTA